MLCALFAGRIKTINGFFLFTCIQDTCIHVYIYGSHCNRVVGAHIHANLPNRNCMYIHRGPYLQL